MPPSCPVTLRNYYDDGNTDDLDAEVGRDRVMAEQFRQAFWSSIRTQAADPDGG